MTKPTKRPTHAEQLAAIKRPHERMAMHVANARLLLALRALYDEQNGPPLPGRHEKAWRVAYRQAGALLKELEPESETDAKSTV